MRAGGCTVQQALTPEAASVVKQAVTLARRRGHAQVTPLHVANTMLTAATGLLRTACLQSHSHPLQCKALELCFNVALNRLPASTSNPMLGSHSQFPSISNALVAAFKRAQAHQRRGSIENQQQPILAVKIELEQLIISILDDPSVSRVMREAGFSSTQVKSNVEQAVSLEICSQNSTAPVLTSKSKENSVLNKVAEPIRVSSSLLSDPITKNEDVMYVINNLMSRKRRNFVIVGECVGNIEGLAREVIERVQKGEVPEGLRDLKFITIPFTSFGNLNRLDIEQKIEEIKSLLRVCIGRGVVLNMGNLEYWVDSYSNRVSSGCDEQIRGYYCSVEHMIMELGKLVCGIGEQSRFWVMGFATFQTYMRCKSGRPSLETVWGLHPLTIPAASLSLSLSTDSELQSQSTNKRGENVSSSRLLLEGRELTCCADCSVKFEAEARNLQRNTDSMITSTKTQLPAWLQQYKNDQNKELLQNNDKGLALRDLCRKWNSICNSIHKHQHYCLEKTLTFSAISPSSSTSVGFSYDLQHQYPNLHKTHHDNWSTTAVEPKNHSLKEHPFLISETINSKNNVDHRLKIFIPDYNGPKQLFPSSNPNSTPNSVSSSSDIMEIEYPRNRFRELNPENLTTLCNALEKKVPWKRDIIPDIASTILKCRSGDVARRKGNEAKEETWFFFQGADVEAKEKIAKELARFVFGSRNNFVSIALSNFSSSMTRADSTEDIIIRRNKRSRDEQSCSTYIERFTEAMSINPHRVFLIEDVDQADYFSLKGFKRAIEVGKLIDYNGDRVGLGDAIIILSCESFNSRSRACSPSVKERPDGSHDEVKATAAKEITSPSVSLDLNISIDDDVITEDQSVDEIGLLESVDKRVIFKILEL